MKHFSVAAIVVYVVAGCAAVPKVEYTKISSPADLRGDEIDSFYFQRSIIKVDRVGSKKTAEGTEVDEITAVSVPAEFADFKIGVRKADSLGVRTNLNLSKRPNTALVQEAGVEVIDTRIDTVTKIGSVVTKLLPLALAVDEGVQLASLPRYIQTHVLLKTVGRGEMKGIDAGDGITIDFGPVPPDARDMAALPNNLITSGIMYSACREATVLFRTKDRWYRQSVKVADPSFYQQVAFPLKGKVSFHDECGASVTSDKDSGIASNAAILEALATQAKAIKDAYDAARKTDAGPAK